MKVYLSGSRGVDDKERFKRYASEIYFLGSYIYLQKKEWIFPFIKKFKGFMLDSSAFTFLYNKKAKMSNKKIDWDLFVEGYADFINKHNIDLFFELDIDRIIGIKEVERLRDKLETLTNKQCIPVWHRTRGREYWLKMIKEYKYVAIGGIAIKEIKLCEFKYFTWLLNEAKKEKCKVHGLGITMMLNKYPFYSVDSSTWIAGNKYGYVHLFTGKSIKIYEKPKGKMVKTKETAQHNFLEWMKFSKYAETNL